MNTNPYSYDQCLAILDFCVGIERHTKTTPDPDVAVLLGKGMIAKIIEMNHVQRLDLIKEISQDL